MFEKEDFEKYMKDNEDYYDNREPMTERKLYQLWKDGAEFGYNKANEWHYVKDGDLPKDRTEKEYLVALKSEYIGFFYETDIWCESLHCFASNNPKNVYAWKEIVPPKEFEND